jgi:uncharacterized membrane protein YkvA (DUF1232 family)
MSWLRWPTLLRTLLSRAGLAVRLVREPHVPLLAKTVPLLAALYLISPFDIVLDFLPLLGQIGDFGLVLIALEAFIRLCPPSAVAFHRAAIAEGRQYSPMSPTDDFIDTEWRHE